MLALGLDFGTESVRALLLDEQGQEVGVASVAYEHGQILDTLPGRDEPLPPHFALQHPGDWIEAAAAATRQALAAGEQNAGEVVGIGVDFTSCTMLPTDAAGRPLCQHERFADDPYAWPKLWKHHGALEQTDRMNAVAQQRGESFLQRYGGLIGLEWLQPKMLETIERAPEVAAAAEVWLEAGDWFVWQLVGGSSPTRSTCQAGYKALWSADDGYPGGDYFAAVHPELAAAVATKLPGTLRSPGERAGTLSESMAERFGLPAGVPVATAIIDAHAAVPGVGAAGPGTLVMVLGTSSCHMLNASEPRPVPGMAGMVEGGILPGLVGYEAGQAAVGDAFDWLRTLLGRDDFSTLAAAARKLPPGAEGVRCLDWMNGCRTPLMDGSLRGAFWGLSLATTPGHLYRALLEGSGAAVRLIVERLREHGVPVTRFIATGGLPHHNPDLVPIYADLLGEPIEVAATQQGPAVGAAILGFLAAGPEVTGFADIAAAIEAVAGREATIVEPRAKHREPLEAVYNDYLRLASHLSGDRL